MIPPAQQQLDEALTNAGHSDACPAFDGRRCPGPPVCEGAPIPDALYAAAGAAAAAEARTAPKVVSELQPRQIGAGEIRSTPDTGATLLITGPAAVALAEYQAAAKELKSLTEVYQRAQQRFQLANQRLADAMAER